MRRSSYSILEKPPAESWLAKIRRWMRSSPIAPLPDVRTPKLDAPADELARIRLRAKRRKMRDRMRDPSEWRRGKVVPLMQHQHGPLIERNPDSWMTPPHVPEDCQ